MTTHSLLQSPRRVAHDRKIAPHPIMQEEEAEEGGGGGKEYEEGEWAAWLPKTAGTGIRWFEPWPKQN